MELKGYCHKNEELLKLYEFNKKWYSHNGGSEDK